MTLGSRIYKDPSTNKPLRRKSGDALLFRPLSPFSPSESGEEEQLPDWALRPRVQRSPREGATYNFNWLATRVSDPATSSARSTHQEPDKSPQAPSPPSAKAPSVTNGDAPSYSPHNVDSITSSSSETITETGSTDSISNHDQLPPAIEHITNSTPQQTLKTARALTQDGKMQAALGHYLYLVKSDQKLDDVVADLEAQRDNPNIEQTPLMLQTLADAYTKTGQLAKALPLYRKALGR